VDTTFGFACPAESNAVEGEKRCRVVCVASCDDLLDAPLIERPRDQGGSCLGTMLYPTSRTPAASGGPEKPMSPTTVALSRSMTTHTPNRSPLGGADAWIGRTSRRSG